MRNIRNVRLVSGLILFAFVASHLFNHVLGILSLDAMEQGRRWFLLIWRNPVGSILLYGSLIVHLLLAAYALYDRRSLRMSWGEAAQLVMGFAIPLVLAAHIIGTRGAVQVSGTEDTYVYVLLAIWKYSPTAAYWQTLGLYAAWIHGCIGLYYWLRLKPAFIRVRPIAHATAILLPVLSWLGFYIGGKEVLALAEDPEWLRAAWAVINPPNAEQTAQIYENAFYSRIFVGGLIAVALVARAVRFLLERRRGSVRVQYPEGKSVRVSKGVNLLEASNLNGIPHASVCGGRGRCSTCRVRIVEGEDSLPEASDAERKVLERVGAPPRVRLACQAVPTADVSIMPLLPPNASPLDGRKRNADLAGQEREIAILFADLRSFTQFSEKKLPYDVVFVLNRYFAQMGSAVEHAGGHLDKFIGDGVMALFGTRSNIETGAKQALEAARGMSDKLADLNEQLRDELDEPLRIGIGIHLGPAIIGEMGYGTATGLTAIGDSVNTASRLESMTKEFGAQLIFSEDVAAHSKIDTTGLEVQETDVRGRDEPVKIFVVKDAGGLVV